MVTRKKNWINYFKVPFSNKIVVPLESRLTLTVGFSVGKSFIKFKSEMKSACLLLFM